MLEVVKNLEKADLEDTIYAVDPWTESSEAVLLREDPIGSIPAPARDFGMSYFIEVAIAKEFLEDWAASQPTTPTEKEKCARLIRYAKNDA